MTDDARLTNCSPTSEHVDRSSDTERRAPDDTRRLDSENPADGASITSTYAWGEYTCSRCGNDTPRVWRDEQELVCPACKPW